MSITQIATFAAAGIKSFEDLADLSTAEFKMILRNTKFSNTEINEIIQYAKDVLSKDSSEDTKQA